jgi:hypothetical protein
MQPEQDQRPELPGGQTAGQRAGQAMAAPQPAQPAGSVLPASAMPASAMPASAMPQSAASAATQPGEQKMFRLPGAIVAWWAWVIFAVACLADIAATGRDHTAAEIAMTVIAVTGLVYACALWPRVVTDSAGITVQNPLRGHRIPWGSVTAVDLRESVQVHCAPGPGDQREKVIHSWALYAQRRNRLRSELLAHGAHGDRRRLPRSAVTSYGDSAAEKIDKQSTAQIMATQLDEMAKEARERGAAAGPRVVTWAWRPALAILVPAVALVLVILVFR